MRPSTKTLDLALFLSLLLLALMASFSLGYLTASEKPIPITIEQCSS